MGTRNESGSHAAVEQGEGGTPLELFRFSIDPFDGWVASDATGAKLQLAKNCFKISLLEKSNVH
jgi:hypothetical protein